MIGVQKILDGKRHAYGVRVANDINACIMQYGEALVSVPPEDPTTLLVWGLKDGRAVQPPKAAYHNILGFPVGIIDSDQFSAAIGQPPQDLSGFRSSILAAIPSPVKTIRLVDNGGKFTKDIAGNSMTGMILKVNVDTIGPEQLKITNVEYIQEAQNNLN
jgi:hypothetical protein